MSGRGQAVNTKGSSVSQIISVILPGILVVQDDICLNWLRISKTFILTGALIEATAKVAAATTAPTFRFERSTNNGSTFASVGTFTMSTGVTYEEITPTWSVAQLDEGDLLRFDVTGIDDGTGANFAFDVLEGP
jgi:hypothetical protein